MLTDTEGAFAEGHKFVDAGVSQRTCELTMCECMAALNDTEECYNYFCKQASLYVDSLKEKGAVLNWRSSGFCRK